MKNIFLISLLFSCFLVKSQESKINVSLVIPTISDLKKQIGSDGSVVYVIGGSTTDDFRGAFYVWKPNSTAAEDMTYYNNIQVTGMTVGRWERTSQTSLQLPQGMMFRLGQLKMLAVSGVTNSSGEFSFNATLENTSTGTPIFSSVLANLIYSPTGNSAMADRVTLYSKPLPSDFKVLSYAGTKPALVVLGGLSITQAGANVPVQIFVIGL